MLNTRLKKAILTGITLLLTFNANRANAAGYYSDRYSPCAPCQQLICPIPCNSNFYLGAEALIWKACNKDQSFGAVTTIDSDSLTTITLQSADHDWSLGFRLLGGYHVVSCCDWELSLAYTNFSSNSAGSFFSVLEIDAVEQDANLRFSNRLNYQTFDALLKKELIMSECGSIRPFFGFRGLWLGQNPTMTIDFTDAEQIFVTSQQTSSVKGFGLHAGSEYHWAVCNGFGIYGTIGASALHGSMNNVHHQIVLEELTVGVLEVVEEVSIIDKQCAPIFGYQLGTGMRYEMNFCGCGLDMLVRFDLGYEFNHWICTPQALGGGLLDEPFEIDVLGTLRNNNGSLLLQGVRIGLGVYF